MTPLGVNDRPPPTVHRPSTERVRHLAWKKPVDLLEGGDLAVGRSRQATNQRWATVSAPPRQLRPDLARSPAGHGHFQHRSERLLPLILAQAHSQSGTVQQTRPLSAGHPPPRRRTDPIHQFAWGLAAVLAGRYADTTRRAVTGATGLLVLATVLYYLLILLVSRRWSGATLADCSPANMAGLRSVSVMTAVWLAGSLLAGPLLGLLDHAVRANHPPRRPVSHAGCYPPRAGTQSCRRRLGVCSPLAIHSSRRRVRRDRASGAAAGCPGVAGRGTPSRPGLADAARRHRRSRDGRRSTVVRLGTGPGCFNCSALRPVRPWKSTTTRS